VRAGGDAFAVRLDAAAGGGGGGTRDFPRAALALLACDACGDDAAQLQRCGGCAGAFYCNAECQGAAWRAGHKAACAAAAARAAASAAAAARASA